MLRAAIHGTLFRFVGLPEWKPSLAMTARHFEPFAAEAGTERGEVASRLFRAVEPTSSESVAPRSHQLKWIGSYFHPPLRMLCYLPVVEKIGYAFGCWLKRLGCDKVAENAVWSSLGCEAWKTRR